MASSPHSLRRPAKIYFAKLSQTIPVGEDRKAPTEFRIFAAGINETDKGAFLFDEQAALLVMDAYAKRGVPMMMDYEHQSAEKPPVIAPASASEFVPEVRNGELWATQIKWTDRARAYIEAGEYRMFSPLFRFDDQNRVTQLMNVALTNLPAMHDIAPLMAAALMAASTPPPEKTMRQMKCSNQGCSQVLSLKTSDEEDGEESQAFCALCYGKKGEMQQLFIALGLASTATEAEAIKAAEGLMRLRTDIVALSGAPSPAESVGKLTAWKAEAAEIQGLRQRVADLETAKLSAELDTLINGAIESGRVPPAQASRDAAIKLAQRDGKITTEGIAALRAFISEMKPIVSTGEIKQKKSGGPPSLTAEQAEVLRLAGRDPAVFEAALNKP